MTVTQTLMGAGRWSVTFARAADGHTALPESIRTQIGLVGWSIVIGPKGLTDSLTTDADRLSAVDAMNGYVGVILERPDEFTLAGQDISWWLGTPDGIGPLIDAGYFYTGSRTTEQIVDAILTGSPNGISKGSVTNGDAVVNPVVPPYSPVIHALNWLCDVSDVEWQIRPDGTLDVAPSATLFPAVTSQTNPTIITTDDAGNEGNYRGVEALQLVRSTDASEIAGRAVVARGEFNDRLRFNLSSQTPTGVEWKDFDGGTPARSVLALAGGATSAQADALADKIIAVQSIDQRAVTLSSRTHNVTANVLPGQRVYAYDVSEGLYDLANQAPYRGQLISPISMRVAELTWPITADHGVYLRQNNGGTWIDVTTFVELEEPVVSWVVSKSGRRVNQNPIRSSRVSIGANGGSGGNGGGGPIPRSDRTRSSAVEGTWTPSWGNVTVGTGGSAANEGTWIVADGQMEIQARFVLGTGGGAAIAGAITLNMPTGWEFRRGAGATPHYCGLCRILAGGTEYVGFVDNSGLTNTALRIRVETVSGTYPTATATSATVPGTFAAGDGVVVNVTVPVQEA